MKIKYLISGGVACVLNILTLLFFQYTLSPSPIFSSLVGYMMGAFSNYLLLYYWTFTSSQHHLKAAQKYGCVLLLTACLNTALFALFYPLLGPIGGQILALSVLIPLNFFINRHVTFA